MRVRNYALVTAGYWAFTLTDGALRMLVLLHFHRLGYSPVAIAFLFLAYEFMGILTNLIGGWVGSRTGLNRTLVAGLGLQIVALVALSFQQEAWREWVSVMFVMAAQALSGVAKDLTKMSSKSAVKALDAAANGGLFTLVALLTGSKNALKGVGFFLGAALLALIGYVPALWAMAAVLAVVVVAVTVLLDEDIGKSSRQAPLRSVLSKSEAINRLSAARFFLFGSRDIWFVVALPVFLDAQLGWSYYGIGGFMAGWVIGYGMVQSVAPRLVLRRGGIRRGSRGAAPAGRGVTSGAGATSGAGVSALDEIRAARLWAVVLAVVSGVMAAGVMADRAVVVIVVGGLMVFGVVFALNSSLHSYLVLAYADDDAISMDVGFYYSANAAGRLVGTLLSGVMYLWGGLTAALWASTAFVVLTWVLTLRLPAITPSLAVAGPGSGSEVGSNPGDGSTRTVQPTAQGDD